MSEPAKKVAKFADSHTRVIALVEWKECTRGRLLTHPIDGIDDVNWLSGGRQAALRSWRRVHLMEFTG